MSDSLNDSLNGAVNDSRLIHCRSREQGIREHVSGSRDEDPPLTLVNVDTREAESFSSLASVIEAGLWPTGERHPVIRTGERDPIPVHTRAAVYYRDKGHCRLCPSGWVDGEWHLDHIIPWSAGGSDRSENLRVLCAKHNLERSNYVIAEERQESPVTWWCLNCFTLDEHEWRYDAVVPDCPMHYSWTGTGTPRCRVQRPYAMAIRNKEPMPTWHRRQGIEISDATLIAYCAHCGHRGLTDVTL